MACAHGGKISGLEAIITTFLFQEDNSSGGSVSIAFDAQRLRDAKRFKVWHLNVNNCIIVIFKTLSRIINGLNVHRNVGAFYM